MSKINNTYFPVDAEELVRSLIEIFQECSKIDDVIVEKPQLENMNRSELVNFVNLASTEFYYNHAKVKDPCYFIICPSLVMIELDTTLSQLQSDESLDQLASSLEQDELSDRRFKECLILYLQNSIIPGADEIDYYDMKLAKPAKIAWVFLLVKRSFKNTQNRPSKIIFSYISQSHSLTQGVLTLAYKWMDFSGIDFCNFYLSGKIS